jgi:hypothetical protein
MSFRRNLACGIAALTLSAGTALAAGATTPASAASVVCGRFCMTMYNENHTGYVMAVSGGGSGTAGQALTMSAAGPDAYEDFQQVDVGTVASVYAEGLVSSVVDQNWPSDTVYEYEYTPAYARSGLCVGTATSGGYDVPVTLQPCGATSTVMWVLLPQSVPAGNVFAPLVNGSDTSATYPSVLFGDSPMITYPLVLSLSVPGYNVFEMWGVDQGAL